MWDAHLGLVHYVVGFDLGHGETALMGVNLKSEHTNDRAFKVEIDGKSTFITAIANHPQHGILIGRDALTTDGANQSWIAFKHRPPEYRDVISQYASHIHKRLLNGRHGFDSNNTVVYIGCPTDWTRDKNLLAAYEAVFREAGFRLVKVVAESRAALMNGVESGDIIATVGELKGVALVIDLGSSTADFTFIDLQKRRAEPLDFGHDLGAALIDKLIFRDTLMKHKRKEELISFFRQSPNMRNRCELACRDAKEAWFDNPKCTPSESVEVIPDDLFFTVRLDESGMQPLLQRPFTDLEDMRPLFGASLPQLSQTTWPDEFEVLLKRAKETGGQPDIILVTGGASRMNFVKPRCQKVFPKAKYAGSPEPEYAIAAGLAYWGRLDIRSQGFVTAVERFSTEKIRPEVAKAVDSLYSGLAADITESVIRIIKAEFDQWKLGGYSTIDSMKSGIDRKIKDWISTELSKSVLGSVNKFILAIGEKLADQIRGLENQYGMPIGALGTSFSSTAVDSDNIDVSLGKIDFTDGVASRLSTIVGVIAGIVTAVVAWVVTPIIVTIVLKIIAAISITLASAIVTILISNPVGWAVLAGIGVGAVIAGTEAKRKVQESLPGWDLPRWVRDLVKKESIYKQIDNHRDEIIQQIAAEMGRKAGVREQIIAEITQVFDANLKERVEDARLLIN